jgi:putative MATE family efflux protein
MDTPENVLPLSTVYMQIYFAGAVSMLVYNFGAAILRAVGDTKRPLYFLSIAGVVNVVLNLIFVTVFHMNVAGVALATTISQTVSATLVVLTLMRRQDACRLVLKELKIHGEQFGRIIKIGLPAGIQGSLFAISNVLIQSSINSFGEIAVSGNAAAGNIEAFVWVMMNAFQQSALNFIGQNMGAKQYGRLKKIMWVCIGCVAAVGLVFGNLAFLFGRPLLGIYITDSAEAIEYGLIRMTFIAVPYLLCGVMDVATGCLRGVGKSMTAMIITIAGACGFRLFWIYTIFRIPAMHTPHSLYMSYPISWAMTFAVELICFIAVVKKLNSNKEPEQA